MEAETVELNATSARRLLERIAANMRLVIRGKDRVVEHVITSLVASGHVLVEDLPGVGKTTLAYSLARSINCSFSRIQFTSDLLPSDVLGVSVFDDRTRDFRFRPGPVFANIVLADEINRTTPKTQSSLLEVMDRSKVTLDGETHTIGQPFMVFATQNPVDYEGTFPLPESQMDRFLMRLTMGFAEFEEEKAILAAPARNYDEITIAPVVTGAEVAAVQELSKQVFLEESLLEYLVRIGQATRTEVEFRTGVSTRRLLAVKRAAQALALMNGRDFVLPDDIFRVALPVLCHRLTLRRGTSDPVEERRMVSQMVKAMIEEIPAPR